MKKLIVLFLLSVFAVLGLASTVYADEENGLIDLYPYNNIGCMTTNLPCNNTRVGTSNWKIEYNGYRYHMVRGSARYAKDFIDANADGFISATEMGTLTFNAFASMIINDTDEEIVLSSPNGRADLTSVVQRIYTYYDGNGVLQMLEDQIFNYHLLNEGTVEAPNWRLATAAEEAAYIAAPADEKPANMIVSTLRMKLDASNPKGYVLEPIIWIQWVKLGINKAVDPVETWSDIIPGNPDYVTIPAGWTVVSYGTLDRDNTNPATVNYIKGLRWAMLDATVDPVDIYYVHQPAAFVGISALDSDLVTPGVNIIVPYQGTFDLPTTITASWINMFNAQGKILNREDKLNYRVEISQEDEILQTIHYTYDSETSLYVASGPVTVIDSSQFGVGYKATWIAQTPKGDITEVVADIAVGVLPPRFVGVKDRYVDEGVVVDLLEGITANDGYSNDKTTSIIVTEPAGLNRFNPKPGQYTINMQFTHNVFLPGVPAIVTVKAEQVSYNLNLHYNKPVAVNADAGVFKVWSDVTHFKTAGSAWGSVMIVVAADGTLKERYDRYNWEHTTSTGTVVGDATLFAAWQANLVLLPGEFVVGAHGSVHATRLRAANLAFGDPVVVQIGKADFSYDIVTTRSYILTIDDITPPTLLIVKPKVVVTAGEFTSVNEVVLGNVVALDNYDTASQLALYVSASGGLNLNNPGTYTVSVTAEDRAGNASVVTFQVEVKAPVITNTSIMEMIENNTITEADVQALINAGKITNQQIQALIDASINQLPEDQVGTSLVTTILVALASGLLSFGAAILLLKKK
jgi:hypothetical protein